MNSILSFTMDQESFALDGLRPNSTTNLFGVIQIHSDSLCFIPPLWAQVQLIGREQVGNTSRIIVNDTYQLSSHSGDWQPSSSSEILSSLPNSIEGVIYSLPFSLSVPSNMPTSFQIYDPDQDFVCCGIYYTLEVRVSSMDESVIQPVHFYRSSNRRSSLQSNNNSTNDVKVIGEGEEEEADDEEESMPKRVFWGITKQSKQRWQYELEFPNTFDLVTSKSGSISVRLRSVYGNRKEIKGDCCLIGCQIIQSIHLEGYQSHVQVLATATELLTCPNKTWSQACQVDFELDDPVLPTVDNERLGVGHCIRISIEFCNAAGASDSCSMDIQFPVVFTGCSLNNTRQQVVSSKNTSATTVTTRKRATSSVSSCSSLAEISTYDRAIEIPSYQSICNYLHSYKLKI